MGGSEGVAQVATHKHMCTHCNRVEHMREKREKDMSVITDGENEGSASRGINAMSPGSASGAVGVCEKGGRGE